MARSIRIESIGGGSRGVGGSVSRPVKTTKGKPKPTAGKGIYKNIITKGGKAGRAIENKMRSEMKLPKLQTTGKLKSIKRNTKVKELMNPITKGKNKDWAKEANKSTNPGNSRRAKIKQSSINTRLEKHPLIRNAGNASSEIKYRVMRGKPVPVKKKK